MFSEIRFSHTPLFVKYDTVRLLFVKSAMIKLFLLKYSMVTPPYREVGFGHAPSWWNLRPFFVNSGLVTPQWYCVSFTWNLQWLRPFLTKSSMVTPLFYEIQYGYAPLVKFCMVVVITRPHREVGLFTTLLLREMSMFSKFVFGHAQSVKFCIATPIFCGITFGHASIREVWYGCVSFLWNPQWLRPFLMKSSTVAYPFNSVWPRPFFVKSGLATPRKMTFRLW